MHCYLEHVKYLDTEVIVEVAVLRLGHVIDKHQAISLCIGAET